MTTKTLTTILFLAISFVSLSQQDSLRPKKVLPPKISHAEPLYSDLVRDLGARRGEHEWNVGAGFSRSHHHEYFSSLVEYEFAPINRLGFEVEVPFVVSSRWNDSTARNSESSIEGFKLSTQYTFLVSERMKTSMAVGYTHEFEFVPFQNYDEENMFHGNDFRPFFVAAKRWGNSFHTMIIAGPEWETHRTEPNLFASNLDVSAHYVLPKTGHFIGFEINNQWVSGELTSYLRPQMRLTLSSTLKIGLVSEIPLTKNERSGFFCRLIYEPRAKLFSGRR